MSDADELFYEAVAALLPALRLFQTALEKSLSPGPEPLAVVAGQGRGSKKPKAKLASVGDNVA